MSKETASSIFRLLNRSPCDYFEINEFHSFAGNQVDLLSMNCCWMDSQPRNIRYRLYFSGVVYLACATGFHNAAFRMGTDVELERLQTMTDFSEFSDPVNLFVIETNRPDAYDDPDAHKQFQTDTYFILAQSVELLVVRQGSE